MPTFLLCPVLSSCGQFLLSHSWSSGFQLLLSILISSIPTGTFPDRFLSLIWSADPSSLLSPLWPCCLWKGILCMASCCPGLAFCPPSHIVLRKGPQVSWKLPSCELCKSHTSSHTDTWDHDEDVAFADNSRKSFYLNNDLLYFPLFLSFSADPTDEERKVLLSWCRLRTKQQCTWTRLSPSHPQDSVSVILWAVAFTTVELQFYGVDL